MLLLPLLPLLLVCGAVAQPSPGPVDAVIASAISNRTFPGAVGAAGRVRLDFGDGGGDTMTRSFKGAWGGLEYAGPADVTTDTVYDIASVSKVFATTTAVALLVQLGALDLNATVAEAVGDARFGAAGGKANVTVRDCLLHQAGFNPDPAPWYWSAAFACPETLASARPAETYSCLGQVYASWLAEELATPPGVVAQYVKRRYCLCCCCYCCDAHPVATPAPTTTL